MITKASFLEQIIEQAQQLSPDDRVRLIQRVAETLLPTKPAQKQYLQYGEFRGGAMSAEEDFLIAEWRPTNEELNGA